MIKDSMCSDGDAREGHLVSYLYDEMTRDDRAAFERHLAACFVCRAELEELDDVRGDLGRWKAPEELAGQMTWRPPSVAPLPAAAPAGLASKASETAPPATAPPARSWWREMPVWAQTAAALFLLGAAAGAANLDVSYGSAGLSIRTGWSAPRPASATPAAVQTSPPWRADLEALARDLRGEVARSRAADAAQATAVPVPADEAVLKQVRVLLHESEQRQQRELALRVAGIVREVQSQRQADLVKIDRNLGLIQRSTGMEVMRTQQQLNNLVQRVSQTR
jgi:hypothetical protein